MQGETLPTRPQSGFTVIGFLGLILAVALVDLRGGLFTQLLSEEPPTLATLADGTWTANADRFLSEHSPFMRATRPLRNETLLALFGETGPIVVPGKAGWLYLYHSLEPLGRLGETPSWSRTNARIDAVRGRLAGEGTHLVVLVMPAKWRLYPEYLPDYEIDRDRLELFDFSVAALRRRGYDAPDLLAFLEEEKRLHPDVLLYPPNDTHFTQAGFRRAAAFVAEKLCGTDPELARTRLEALPREPGVHPGDLPANLSIPPTSAVGRSHSYEEEFVEAPPCLDTSSAEILCTGDSFFAAYDGLFQRLIQVATGRTVDSRFAGVRTISVESLMAEYGDHRPAFVLLATTERQFD